MGTLFLSAIAIAMLTALAWAMGFRTDPMLDEAAAIAEAEGRLPGFRAAGVALAAGGRGALLRDAAGQVAVVLPLGDGWVVRRVPADSRLRHEQAVLHIAFAEPLLRDARLPLATMPGWLEGGLA